MVETSDNNIFIFLTNILKLKLELKKQYALINYSKPRLYLFANLKLIKYLKTYVIIIKRILYYMFKISLLKPFISCLFKNLRIRK